VTALNNLSKGARKTLEPDDHEDDTLQIHDEWYLKMDELKRDGRDMER